MQIIKKQILVTCYKYSKNLSNCMPCPSKQPELPNNHIAKCLNTQNTLAIILQYTSNHQQHPSNHKLFQHA